MVSVTLDIAEAIGAGIFAAIIVVTITKISPRKPKIFFCALFILYTLVYV
jgi:hypothetical protein